ncbi:MAG: c-type cytochrome [Longimicrobiales bacterium]|nr:c-type cytochrome [Longimicrobiales bacterium]
MGSTTVTNLKIFGTVLATLGLYTWVANAIPQLESEVPEEVTFSAEATPEELAAVGEDLFVGAGGCTACHGAGTRAPNLRAGHAGEGPVGARCDARVPEMTCQEYLYESMVDPGAYLVEGFGNIMPPQDRILTSNQIWALVAYMQSLGGNITVTPADIEATAAAEPAAPSAGGDVPMEPVAIMQGNACLGCHILGDQGVELGPELTGVGSRLSADEIRASIVDPNAQASEGFESLVGTMPATYEQSLTDAQLDALVEFLAAQE